MRIGLTKCPETETPTNTKFKGGDIVDADAIEVTQGDLKLFQTLRDTVSILRTVAEDELMVNGHTFAAAATLTMVIRGTIDMLEVIDLNEQALISIVGEEFGELFDFGGGEK